MFSRIRSLLQAPCSKPHAQQAVEKILKAFLISRGAAAPRTHNLVALLDAAVELEPSTADLKEACSLLTPYAVDLRYPGDIGVVERGEATLGMRLIYHPEAEAELVDAAEYYE